MEAFLDLLAAGKLNLQPIITHRFSIEKALAAYDLITGKTGEPFLGVLIHYPTQAEPTSRVNLSSSRDSNVPATEKICLGVIGAGMFAVNTLLPAIKEAGGAELAGVCTATGPRSRHAAEKFGFRYCSTDENEIFGDKSINAVVIATRHNLHARQVLTALSLGKHVFCEKPLCLAEEDLAEIVRQHTKSEQIALMVGFNRRFSPMALRMKAFFAPIHEPLLMHYRVNAGFLAANHWTQDLEEGGGRILGEVCHFIDFLTNMAGAWPVWVQTHALANHGLYSDDNLTIQLEFANGSQGTITYVANGDKAFSKERVEVFGGGAGGVLEDFRKLELVRGGRKQTERSRLSQDKGHRAEWDAFLKTLRTGGAAPIPFDEIVAVSLATLRALDSRRLGQAVTTDTRVFLNAALRPQASAVDN